ncbi:MAG TPA: TolC family protein [Thermoguttaceae bacterium]|nr:TolC family protein [Thermoguttaceae bacterium]
MRSRPDRRLFVPAKAAAISIAILLLAPADPLPAQRPEPLEPDTASGYRLTLDQCIGIALENQPAIRAQHAAMCAAVERGKIAGSYFLPQIDFHARYANIDEPRSVDIPSPFAGQVGDVFSSAAAFFDLAGQYGGNFANAALEPTDPLFPVANPLFNQSRDATKNGLPDEWSVGLLGENSLTTEFLLTQPLWTGGKIRYRHQQAQLGVSMASADVAKSKQQTVFDVTRAYLGVQLAVELSQVMDDAVGHFRAIERLIHALLDEANEHVTMVDLHRVRAVRALAESERVRVEQAAQIAHEALRQAMGLDPMAQFEIADYCLTVEQRHVELPDILGQAMVRRPELAKARLGVQIAGLQRQLAAAEYSPDLALFGRFATIDDDGGFPNPNDRQEWAVGLNLDAPLYAGGRRAAQKRHADFEQARAARLQQLARQLITLEVQKTYLEYVEMHDRLALAKTAREEASGTVEALGNEYKGGFVEEAEMPDHYEDLTQAHLVLALAGTRYYTTIYGHNIAVARIRLVTASDEQQSASSEAQVGVAYAADRSWGDAGDSSDAAAGGPNLP